MKTVLDSRVLWFDGVHEVDASKVPYLLFHGIHPNKIVVRQPDDEVRRFNQLSDDHISSEKNDIAQLDKSWAMPLSYQELDLGKLLHRKLQQFLQSENIPENRHSEYSNRLNDELLEIESSNVHMLFRSLVYVVDKFRETSTVWGVGRGSSCASLVLFLIGLHSVDPVKWNIPKEEFFR